MSTSGTPCVVASASGIRRHTLVSCNEGMSLMMMLARFFGTRVDQAIVSRDRALLAWIAEAITSLPGVGGRLVPGSAQHIIPNIMFCSQKLN